MRKAWLYITIFCFLPGCTSVTSRVDAIPIKIALVGDSTVTDEAGWGKAFALSFNSGVSVKNFSVAGRSSKSWLAEGNLSKVLIEKPDYVLIQFGHNDQPGKGAERETDPNTTYQRNLQFYVDQMRKIGAKPIIVSSVSRRNFDSNGVLLDSLGPWAEASRSVAFASKVPFVDLHTLSIHYYNRVGPEKSMSLDFKEGDRTHFNSVGARVIADLILNELNVVAPELIEYRIL